MTKHKYQVGDEVLVRYRITERVTPGGIEDRSYYGVELVDGDKAYSVMYEVSESQIESLAPMAEPTTPNTVVVLDNKPWILAGGYWYTSGEGGKSWTELLVLGTPRVVWTPENE